MRRSSALLMLAGTPLVYNYGSAILHPWENTRVYMVRQNKEIVDHHFLLKSSLLFFAGLGEGVEAFVIIGL